MKRKRLLLATLLCGMTMGLKAQSSATTLDPLKIVVVSDPHVMAPELLEEAEDSTAWKEYLAGQRKLVDYSQQLFDEMIRRIKDEIRPGLVLITGDLTKDGELLSHKYVANKLNELRASGIKALVIPGNHDGGNNSNAVYYNGETTRPATVITQNNQFISGYAKYGYGNGSELESNTLTYACEPIAGLVVIGIDSSSGEIASTTLQWVAEKASAARLAGKRVIAMMHHPLIPHFTGVDSFVNTATVNDYETVRNTLADAGVSVVFTGHFHTSDIAKDWNGDMTKEIYDVNTGSLISYPCDYRVVTLSNDLSTMHITTEHISELPGDEEFSAEMAKGRLHDSVEKSVSDKGTAYSMISKTAADAFIIHAEGNENENSEAAETLKSLQSAASLGELFGVITSDKAKAMKDMATSMLEDKSNYGTDRQNVTNDLTLDITLPGDGVRLSAAGYATYCSENRLDISQTEGLSAYTVSDITDTKVVLKTVGVIPAETGFIVKGTGGEWYSLPTTNAIADNVSDNLLQGTLTATPAAANTFALTTKNNVTGFYPVSTGLQIPAHKAYLTVSDSQARELSFGGDATGIDTLDYLTTSPLDNLSDAWYDLSGRKIIKPSNGQMQKGVYVSNGKLVIIK